jgi:trimeric autotransporter adhesin
LDSAGTPFILTRATDFDTVGTGVDQIDEGDFFLVTGGTANANTAWVQQTPPPIIIGTTPIVFQQFSAPITYTAGTGLNESPAYTFNIANTTVSAATYGSASAVPVFAVNAQGQLTSVTDTAIAINGSAVTGAISGQAGSVANALTLGTYLTGTSYNGGTAVTATVDATDANTASKVVARDASGNFSAGTITATLSGNATNVSGTVAFANGGTGETTRQAAMDALAGAVTSGQYLRGNGSDVVMSTIQAGDVPTLNQNTTGNATTATTATNLAGGSAGTVPYQSAAGTTAMLAAGTSGQLLQSNGAAAPSWVAAPVANNGTLTMAVSGTGLSGSATFTANQSGNSTFTVTSNATNANTGSTIVARDASGNFSAGTITASLTGNASGSAATFTSTSQNSQFNSIGVGTAASGTAGEIRATNNVHCFLF